MLAAEEKYINMVHVVFCIRPGQHGFNVLTATKDLPVVGHPNYDTVIQLKHVFLHKHIQRERMYVRLRVRHAELCVIPHHGAHTPICVHTAVLSDVSSHTADVN